MTAEIISKLHRSYRLLEIPPRTGIEQRNSTGRTSKMEDGRWWAADSYPGSVHKNISFQEKFKNTKMSKYRHFRTKLAIQWLIERTYYDDIRTVEHNFVFVHLIRQPDPISLWKNKPLRIDCQKMFVTSTV